MNKFDINAARLISINIIICLIFIIVVWKAYDYLPEKNANQEISSIITNEDSTNNINEESNEENDDENSIEAKDEKIKLEDLEIIEFESSTHPQENTTKEEIELTPLETAIKNAEDSVKNKEYEKAIENYKVAVTLAFDSETRAMCYEKIATIYAYQKRYGSALSAAQRAFNNSPDSYRETLLAKLYYKTGNIEEAHARINNVLKRDFELR